MQADVCKHEQVCSAILRFKEEHPKFQIRGVFNSAVVFRDGMFDSLTEEAYEQVLEPKVRGTVNLLLATCHEPLDTFTQHSSVVTCTTNIGQSNYAAGNGFQDGLMPLLRRVGVPAQALNWSGLNTGVLEGKTEIQEKLKQRGLPVLNLSTIHYGLRQAALLNQYTPQVILADFRFDQMHASGLANIAAASRRFKFLMNAYGTPEGVEDGSNAAELKQKTLQKIKKNGTVQYIKEVLGRAIMQDTSRISPSTTIQHAGLESNTWEQFQSQVKAQTGHTFQRNFLVPGEDEYQPTILDAAQQLEQYLQRMSTEQ